MNIVILGIQIEQTIIVIEIQSQEENPLASSRGSRQGWQDNKKM